MHHKHTLKSFFGKDRFEGVVFMLKIQFINFMEGLAIPVLLHNVNYVMGRQKSMLRMKCKSTVKEIHGRKGMDEILR